MASPDIKIELRFNGGSERNRKLFHVRIDDLLDLLAAYDALDLIAFGPGIDHLSSSLALVILIFFVYRIYFR